MSDALLSRLTTVKANSVMAKSDWKAPFLEFRDQLRPLFDSGVKLYHGILMAPFHERDEIKEVVENLPAADLGQSLAFSVDTPTDDCKYHAHYFYGDNSTCLLLAEALSGIDNWIREVPKGLLPVMNFQHRRSSREVMAVWANLVFYLAWECDAPYLQATVEFQSRLHEVSSYDWQFGSWSETCDPRPILIQQGDPRGRFGDFLESFTDEQWCPDIIGAYLRGEPFCGDLIGASLAAVDVLVFMLEIMREQSTVKQNELPQPVKRRSTKRRRVSSDVMLLKGFLRVHHDPRETGDKAETPLTAMQIAEYMQWFNKNGEPVQSRASRRMEDIFGPDAMNKYRRAFQGGISRGFRKLLDDGSSDVESIGDHESDEDESEENDIE